MALFHSKARSDARISWVLACREQPRGCRLDRTPIRISCFLGRKSHVLSCDAPHTVACGVCREGYGATGLRPFSAASDSDRMDLVVIGLAPILQTSLAAILHTAREWPTSHVRPLTSPQHAHFCIDTLLDNRRPVRPLSQAHMSTKDQRPQGLHTGRPSGLHSANRNSCWTSSKGLSLTKGRGSRTTTLKRHRPGFLDGVVT